MRSTILNLVTLLLPVALVVSVDPVFSQQTHPFRPADASLPPQREGGSRNANIFVPQQPPITALTPKQGGVTVKEYPSFFVFIPQFLDSIENLSAEFAITDKQDNVIYETVIQLPQQASIIQINFPQTEASTGLEINQTYQWYFAVRSGLETVETVLGAIQRIEPSQELVKLLENTQTQQDLEKYQQEGVWYETLSTLAELYQGNPENAELVNQWKNLFKSVDLEQIADIPLAEISFNSQQPNQSEYPGSSPRFSPPDGGGGANPFPRRKNPGGVR